VVYGKKKCSITQLVFFFRSFFFFREAAIEKLVLMGFWKLHGDFYNMRFAFAYEGKLPLRVKEVP